MSLAELKNKIEQHTAKIAVIGLGYVGLPVAAIFAEVGFDVLGIEIKADRVKKINAGLSPIEGEEPGLSELLARVSASKKLRSTSNYHELSDREIILIDVETPVDDQNVPRYEALRASLENLAPVMKPGALVIIESTIAPKTMQDFVLPILEKNSGKKVNQDFYLGNCPERVMPGKLLSNLQHLSRVVGGGNAETAETMIALYRLIVHADLDAVDWITAELVKTTENAYRDCQIAFANEVALICEALNGDVWKVRELVNKSPFRNMHLPGAGVGGHCIPKDPWLLAYGVKDSNVPLRLIPTVRKINDSMPLHIAEIVVQYLKKAGKQINQSRILVMGYAYLEDSDDTRNSPSTTLVRHLTTLGADICIQDPYILEYQGDVYEKAAGCDAAVVMVSHSAYKALDLNTLGKRMRTPILVIGRKIFDEDQIESAKKTFSYLFQSGVGEI